VVGLPRLDDNGGAGLCLRHRCGAQRQQGDGNSGECIAGHGDLLRMIPCGTGDFMVQMLRQAGVGELRSLVKLCFLQQEQQRFP
jgi:hypothetical protein